MGVLLVLSLAIQMVKTSRQEHFLGKGWVFPVPFRPRPSWKSLILKQQMWPFVQALLDQPEASLKPAQTICVIVFLDASIAVP